MERVIPGRKEISTGAVAKTYFQSAMKSDQQSINYYESYSDMEMVKQFYLPSGSVFLKFSIESTL